MNSLEFIDEEIKRYKAIVSIVTGERKSYYKKVVNQLNQIKAELEAWYVVQEQLCLRIADHENKLLRTKYGLQVEYDNIIPLTDEETKSFIKALGLEDE